MANSIASVQEYLNSIIEQTYRMSSLTTFLDTQGVEVNAFSNAKTVNIPKLVLEGLSDYNRATGYTSGDATLSYIPYTLTKDRGKKFMLDAVDNIESAGVALANLASTFLRDYVVPELDAYRFSQYVDGADTANVKAQALTKTNIIGALDDASSALTDAEVPEENRILFVSSATRALMMQAMDSSRFHTTTVVNRKITMFDDMPLIVVPAGRFYDAVTLKATGWGPREASGVGVSPAIAAAVGLNFIMIDRTAPLQIVKHNPARIFSPEQNQDADAWVYNYRCYHDAFIRKNKAKGVYVHKKASS